MSRKWVTPGVVLANFVEDTSTSIATAALLANDTDVDGGPLVVSAVDATSAHGGTLTLQGGVITYTPSANFNGADQFSYTVSDGHGGTATGTLSFTVAAVNDAPVLTGSAKSRAGRREQRQPGWPDRQRALCGQLL